MDSGFINVGFDFEHSIGCGCSRCSGDLGGELAKLKCGGVLLCLGEELGPGKMEDCPEGGNDGGDDWGHVIGNLSWCRLRVFSKCSKD